MQPSNYFVVNYDYFVFFGKKYRIRVFNVFIEQKNCHFCNQYLK